MEIQEVEMLHFFVYSFKLSTKMYSHNVFDSFLNKDGIRTLFEGFIKKLEPSVCKYHF